MFENVTLLEFKGALKLVQASNEQIKNATTPWEEINDDIKFFSNFYLDYENQCGFAVSFKGELTSVFSLKKKQGDHIVRQAIKVGATHLDCFDGYLPTLYSRHGFKIARKEDNWTNGEPCICYMNLTR